jgi:hypothetical protein
VIAAPHLAAGLVAGMAGAGVRGPVALRAAAAFTIGFLMHVPMDAIPHSDYLMVARSSIPLIVLGEAVATGLVAAFLLRDRLPARWPLYLLAGMSGSALLDAKFFTRLLLPEHVTAVVTRYGDWIHSYFHASDLSQPLIGLAIEAVATVVLLIALTAFPRTAPGAASTP